MKLNKKMLYLSMFIVVLLITITGTTTALKNYQEEIVIDKNEKYTTSYLEINNNSAEGSNLSFDLVPMNDEEGLEKIESQTFTITNTGNLPYVFNIQFLSKVEGGINSSYIRIQVDDFSPMALSVLNKKVENNELLSNYYLFPGESINVKVKVWLDKNTPNTELGKGISLNLVTTGYADKIYRDKEGGVLEGEGTKEAPYIIGSVEDLAFFSEDVAKGNNYENKYVKLISSLDFDNAISYANQGCLVSGEYSFNDNCQKITEFGSIGNESNPFKGIFEGEGHVIKNIPYTDLNVGLFGNVNKASISNVILEGNYEINNASKNIIVGSVVDVATDSVISNCYNKSNYIVNNNGKDVTLGGIVGINKGTKLYKNYNYGKIIVNDSASNYVGGIIGKNVSKSESSNNYNYGMLGVTASKDNYVGGIVGTSEYSTTSISSTNSDNYAIAGANAKNVTITGSMNYVGGISGYAVGTMSGAVLENSIVTSSGSNVGGITGFYTGYTGGSASSIASSNFFLWHSYCSNSTIKGTNNVGGIVGIGSIDTDNYNYGIVSGDSDFNNYVGGVIGKAEREVIKNYNYGLVRNSNYLDFKYNDGKATYNYIGGIVGYSSSNISSSVNEGRIVNSNSKSNSYNYIGGIVGYGEKDIDSNSNKAKINVKSVNDINNVGGISGEVLDNIKISKSNNSGFIKASNGNIGGIVGSALSKDIVINSYNTGNIEIDGSSANKVGGIVGNIQELGLVSEGYNLGKIKINTGDSVEVGGIVGSSNGNSSINYVYNLGDIKVEDTKNGNVGGIVGTDSLGSVKYAYTVGNINLSIKEVLVGSCIGKIDNGTTDNYQVYSLSNISSKIDGTNLLDTNKYLITNGYLKSLEFLKILNKEDSKWKQSNDYNSGYPYLISLEK